MRLPGRLFRVLGLLIMVIIVAMVFFVLVVSVPVAKDNGTEAPGHINSLFQHSPDAAFQMRIPSLRFYRDTVPPDTKREWVNLSWTDPSCPRSLFIYTPDETLGPYSDSSNGVINQRVYLMLYENSALPSGQWYYEVRTKNNPMNDTQILQIVREQGDTEDSLP